MAITVLVADPKSVSRQELVNLLGRDRTIEVIGDAREGQEAIEMARSLRPSVVLLDGSVAAPDITTSVENLQLVSPETAIIVLIDGVNMELVRRLMRGGARDVLVKPVGVDDLLNTIRSVHHTLQKHRAAIESGAEVSTSGGQMIAIYSPQGGAGKSVLSANLGIALATALNAQGQKGRVALVDLNLQFGDIDLMLNLSPEHTLAGLAQKGAMGMDADLIEQYLTPHEESGLRVLGRALVAPTRRKHHGLRRRTSAGCDALVVSMGHRRYTLAIARHDLGRFGRRDDNFTLDELRFAGLAQNAHRAGYAAPTVCAGKNPHRPEPRQ